MFGESAARCGRLGGACAAVIVALVVGCGEGGTVDAPDADGRILGDAGPVRDLGNSTPPDLGLEPADAEAFNPRINSIIPARGPIEGGTRIRLVGREFVDGMRVTLGDRACGDLVVDSENHVLCTAPEGDAPQPVDVAVFWPDVSTPPAVLTRGYTYFVPVTLDAIDPARSAAPGGITVTLSGGGFVDPTQVRIGGRIADRVEWLDDSTLTARVPPGEPGPADVEVNNLNGSARLERAFVYTESLVVDDVRPRWGTTRGGDPVVLDGFGLMDGTSVRFGDAPAVSGVSALGRRRLTVATPPHAPGVVGLRVENSSGEWSEDAMFLYVDGEDDEFGVHGVVPFRLSADGGAEFWVGGGGFTEQTRVALDDELVFCERVSGQVLRCVAPVRAPGLVDVEVRDGERRVVLPQALLFYEPVELFDLRPPRGAIAGGTLVEIVGRGLRPELTLSLEGGALEVLEVAPDGGWALARTPPGLPGWAALRAAGDGVDVLLTEAFEYFNPVTRYGGVWGEPIDRSVNVSVFDALSGEPLEDAVVFAVAVDGQRWAGETNAEGQVTLSHLGLSSPVSVTAAQLEYEVQTFERVTAENVTIYLYPHVPPEGAPGGRDPIPLAELRGTVTGLDVLEKPREPGYVVAAFVETTHSSIYNRVGLPPPAPRGILLEDGPFEIRARPGELAVVVTAGYVGSGSLEDYRRGLIGYWALRARVLPVAIGWRRFISASPGRLIEGLEVHLDRPMNRAASVTLGNPSGGVPGAPDWYTAYPALDFGPEGYSTLDTFAEGASPLMRVEDLPSTVDWDPDVRLHWRAEAITQNLERTPYAVTFITERVPEDAVVIGPFVGTPRILSPGPLPESSLGPDRVVEWEVHPGVTGPTEPAHVNYISIQSGGGLPLWTHVVPGAVTRYELPLLPEDLLPGGLIDERMHFVVVPMILTGQFSFEDFTYGDLGVGRRRSYSTNSITFFR